MAAARVDPNEFTAGIKPMLRELTAHPRPAHRSRTKASIRPERVKILMPPRR